MKKLLSKSKDSSHQQTVQQPTYSYQETVQQPLHRDPSIRSPHLEQSSSFQHPQAPLTEQNPAQPPIPTSPELVEKKGGRFRDFIGLGGSKDQTGPPKSVLSRKVSTRTKNPANLDRYSVPDDPRGQRSDRNPVVDGREKRRQSQIGLIDLYQTGPPAVPVKDEELYQQQQIYYPPPGTQHIPVSQNFHQVQVQVPNQIQVQAQSQTQDIQQQHPQQPQHNFDPYTQSQQLQLSHQIPLDNPPSFEQSVGISPTSSANTNPNTNTNATTTSTSNHPQYQPRYSSESARHRQQHNALQENSQPVDILQPHPRRGTNASNTSSSNNQFLNAAAAGPISHKPPSPLPNLSLQPEESNQISQFQQQEPPVHNPPSPTGTHRSAPSPMPPPSRSGTGATKGGIPNPQRELSIQGGPRGNNQHGAQIASIEADRQSGTTPNLPDGGDEETNQYQALQEKYKELNGKYQKVKRFYFEKESQVHQLQNTLANQRLSASRTSLDDSEYIARFDRLGGLMGNVAFAIRKNWKQIPNFLVRSVNKEAILAGKQETMAVGRAFLSWWLYLHVFDRIFHPDLDLRFSIELKNICRALRHNAPTIYSVEEEESLAAKISAWRMSTVEGLTDHLRSHEAQDNRERLIQLLNDQLIKEISQYLTEPTPDDVFNGIPMIVELAVNIAIHLPLESREVSIEYCPPFATINQEYMKLESGIPPLTNPIAPYDTNSEGSNQIDNTDMSDFGEDDNHLPQSKDDAKKKSGNILGNLMGGNAGSQIGTAVSSSGKGNAAGGSAGGQLSSTGSIGKGGSNVTNTSKIPPATNELDRETSSKEERVRLAIGLGVVIRNRSVLVKVPIYTTHV